MNNSLSPHCWEGNCKWCTERRERKRRQEIAADVAKMAPTEHWDRKTSPIVAGYWPPPGAGEHVEKSAGLAWGGRGVKYLHEPTDRTEHRRAPKRWIWPSR